MFSSFIQWLGFILLCVVNQRHALLLSLPKSNKLLLLVTLVVAPIEKLIKSEPNFAKILERKFWKVIFHLTTL